MATVKSIWDSVRKLHDLLKVYRKEIISIYILVALGGLLQLSVPLGIQAILGFVTAGRFSVSITVLIGLVLLGVFLNGLLNVREQQILEKIKQHFFVATSFRFSEHLPSVDVERTDGEYMPEKVNRFFDVVGIQKSLEKILLDMPTSVIQIVFGIILLSFYHPLFIAFGFALLVVLLLIVRLTSTKGLNSALATSSYKYKMAAWLQEIARTINTFKFTTEAKPHLAKTNFFVNGYLENRTGFFKILLTQFWSLIAFKVLIVAGMLILGSLLLVNNQINIGQFVAADIVIITIMNAVEKLISTLSAVYEAAVSAEKLSQVTDLPVENGGSILLPESDTPLRITLQNVAYKYPDGKQALNQVTSDIPAGSLVQIKGKSGSGKSTLLRLLTGGYQNFDGVILINGIPIRNYDLLSLRSQMGILQGKQDIFDGTILDNILMGDSTIPMEQVNEVAAVTGLLDFVNKSKEGYFTQIKQQGIRLPKHIWKSILISRALLTANNLLLMEDPFSELDKKYAMLITDYIKNKLRCTAVIVAEDDGITPNFDQVIETDKFQHS